MKLLSFFKHKMFARPWKKSNRAEHYLTYNNQEIEKSKVVAFELHHDTYKYLRSFKTPQYDTYYLLRKKQGFNTILFQQNYDVIIADHNGTIIDMLADVQPGYTSNFYKEGYYIYFTPVGTISHYNFAIKGTIRIGRYLFRDYF